MNTEDISKECFFHILNISHFDFHNEKTTVTTILGASGNSEFKSPLGNPPTLHLKPGFKSSSTDGLMTQATPAVHSPTHTCKHEEGLPWNTRKFLPKIRFSYRISPFPQLARWPRLSLVQQANLSTDYTRRIFVAMGFKLWTMWFSWWICC